MDVVARDLGVPIEVAFVAAKHAKVVVNLVVRAAVVVVKAPTICGIVCYDEIVMHVVERGDSRGLPRSDSRDVREPVLEWCVASTRMNPHNVSDRQYTYGKISYL